MVRALALAQDPGSSPGIYMMATNHSNQSQGFHALPPHPHSRGTGWVIKGKGKRWVGTHWVGTGETGTWEGAGNLTSRSEDPSPWSAGDGDLGSVCGGCFWGPPRPASVSSTIHSCCWAAARSWKERVCSRGKHTRVAPAGGPTQKALTSAVEVALMVSGLYKLHVPRMVPVRV